MRKARRADLVIANHALVMIQAAIGGDDGRQPTRLVFDEGHHIFDAADGAFAAQLSARETTDLRRWLIGTEHRRGGRARGLKRRLEDLIADDETALAAVEEILGAARALPAEGWHNRLIDGAPRGPIEGFCCMSASRSTPVWPTPTAPIPSRPRHARRSTLWCRRRAR